MGEHRCPAGRPYQRERVEDVDVRLRQPVPLPEPPGPERLRHRTHQPACDECVRHVRPAHGATGRVPAHLLDAHVDPVGAQQFDHPVGAVLARLPYPAQLGRQLRVRRIEQVRQQVQPNGVPVGVPAAGQFGAADQGQPGRQRRLGGGPPGGGVVVGKRDHVEPGPGGRGHDLGRREGTVTRGRVRMQIDTHHASPVAASSSSSERDSRASTASGSYISSTMRRYSSLGLGSGLTSRSAWSWPADSTTNVP